MLQAKPLIDEANKWRDPRGPQQDYPKAAALLKQAAEMGCAMGQFQYADMILQKLVSGRLGQLQAFYHMSLVQMHAMHV